MPAFIGAPLTVDTAAPTLVSASINGNAVTLTFSETLDAAHQPDITNLRVDTNGTPRGINLVRVSGNTVVLSLGGSASSTDAVTIATRDVAGDDAYAIQDLAGNDAAGVPTTIATNLTSPALVETPSITSANFTTPATGTSTVNIIFTQPVSAFNQPTLVLYKLGPDGSTSVINIDFNNAAIVAVDSANNTGLSQMVTLPTDT